MDLGLKDHVIAVTGGASGIGEAITRACLAEGAQVVVISRRTPRVDEFLEEMNRNGARCVLFEGELEKDEVCASAVVFIQQHFGRLDALVNNAGANDSIGLEEGSPANFLESLKRNLVHYYAMAHYALPLLKASRGAIVNVSSKVALTGQGGTSAYAAAKGAQLALTREWAAELLPYGIRVNSLVPAEVLTPLYRQWIERQADPDDALRRISSNIPLGRRMTDGAEIAAMCVFLLSSNQSGHTTAQHVVVDGGYIHLDRTLT